jgi:hypothetical protein
MNIFVLFKSPDGLDRSFLWTHFLVALWQMLTYAIISLCFTEEISKINIFLHRKISALFTV